MRKPVASPRQILNIIDQINKIIWCEYVSYDKVLSYIKRWQERVWNADDTIDNGYYSVNFEIVYKDQGKKNINLMQTLNNMNDELLFKIAVDIGVQVPNIIYAVPQIISLASKDYTDVHSVLEVAYKKVEQDPSHSIALANSALETIIKRILSNININYSKKDTLYNLAQTILKEFKMFHGTTELKDVRDIGSGLLKISKSIEDLRSNHTKEAHGKLDDDYVIDDPLYAYLLINAVSTIGLFLLNFYEKKYKKNFSVDDDIPF